MRTNKCDTKICPDTPADWLTPPVSRDSAGGELSLRSVIEPSPGDQRRTADRPRRVYGGAEPVPTPGIPMAILARSAVYTTVVC